MACLDQFTLLFFCSGLSLGVLTYEQDYASNLLLIHLLMCLFIYLCVVLFVCFFIPEILLRCLLQCNRRARFSAACSPLVSLHV